MNPYEALARQAVAAMEKIRVDNLNLKFILLALDSDNKMVTCSSAGLEDSLTRVSLLMQSALAETEKLQQALHQAANAEAVRLIQESAKIMTKQ